MGEREGAFELYIFKNLVHVIAKAILAALFDPTMLLNSFARETEFGGIVVLFNVSLLAFILQHHGRTGNDVNSSIDKKSDHRACDHGKDG